MKAKFLTRLYDSEYSVLSRTRDFPAIFLQIDRLPPRGARRFSFGGEMNWMTILFAVGGVAIVRGPRFKMSRRKKATPQVVREGSFELDTSAGRALLFFTPEGERAWVKDWDPKPVYPPQAVVEFRANSVFRVNHGGERSLWTIVAADSQELLAEYMYVVQGQRVSRVRVQIEPLGEHRCRVRVRYVHTATSEKGLHFVASVTEKSYAKKMLDWRRMVSAAIR
jgi:hypothetical protein